MSHKYCVITVMAHIKIRYELPVIYKSPVVVQYLVLRAFETNPVKAKGPDTLADVEVVVTKS